MISLIEKWTFSCEINHPYCRQHPSTPLPRRLIDIASLEANSVVLIDGLESCVPYIALSYCWGSKTQLTTTRITLDQRKTSIAVTDLPLTFQEVFMVAHRLNIRYVWIDALCIVQDDE
jgi:hypothetical protein